MLSHGPGLDGLAFSLELQPGDLLVINDRVVWHYTSPVTRTGDAPCIMMLFCLAGQVAGFEQ